MQLSHNYIKMIVETPCGALADSLVDLSDTDFGF